MQILRFCTAIIVIFLLTLLVLVQYSQAVDNKNPVVIMFLGLSGSGKSSTVNALFNQTITEVGSGRSTTSEILEFSIQSPNSNMELRIIDTPGLQDTSGLATDARFLATLDDYLDTHEFLSLRPPDVVIICQRFDDNRFADQSASFIKMLKSIITFQNRLFIFSDIVGQDSVPQLKNVLFALTHFMGVNLQIQKNPFGKLTDFRSAVKQFTSLPGENIPMLFVENSGDAQELEAVPGGHLLPSGDIYPQNLCTSILKILRNQRPNLSTADIKICKGEEELLDVKLLSNISLVQISHPKAVKHLSSLISVNINAAETEVSRKLVAAYTKLTATQENSSSLANTLGYLQISLHNLRIFNVSDIPRTEIAVAELYRSLKKDSGVRDLLETAFKLKPSAFTPFSLLAGRGYSFLQDGVLPTSPLKFSSSEFVSCLGYMLPSGMECKIIMPTKLKSLVKDVATMDDYISQRAIELSVSRYAFSWTKTIASLKPGYTLPSSSKRSFYIEFQSVEMEIQHMEPSATFLNALNSLPRFNSSSRTSLTAFEQLFALYGTHFLSKMNYGGFIEFVLSKDLVFEAVESFELVLSLIDKYSHLMKIKIHGGDYTLHSSKPSVFFSESKGISLFSKWKASLLKNPIPLVHSPTALLPLSSVLRATGKYQNKLQEIERALAYFHSNEYVNDGPERMLNNSWNSCTIESQTQMSELAACEKVLTKTDANCKEEAKKCEELEAQSAVIRWENESKNSDIHHAKSTLLMKELENYSLRLRKEEVEGRVKQLETSLGAVRAQLNAEKVKTAKLKADLANRG